MSNSLLNYFICGSLGVLLHLMLKISNFIKLGKKANHPFSMKGYLQDDWPTIVADFLSVGILIFCLDEIVKFKPAVVDYIKWLFVFVGFTGSSIITGAMSVTGNKLMQVIDVKSNLADGKVPPVNEGNLEGAKEIIKEIKKQSDEPEV